MEVAMLHGHIFCTTHKPLLFSSTKLQENKYILYDKTC